MKYIGILSDTHGFVDPAIFDYLKDCDEIWHAGDFGNSVSTALSTFKPLKGVYGNIDGTADRQRFPEDLLFNCEGIRIFITHIGGYPNHYPSRVKRIIETARPDLFISGHSHILKIVRDPVCQLLHINPGAAGRSGFHQVRTMVRLKIDAGKISGVEVIELGKRSVK
ncbi:MAG: metallophosphatase family protein [Chitinophagales bacterium]|nr:metallophosphatase family protein [Chitinophagales bacterium]